MSVSDTTIAAVSTGRGGAIALIRLSGPSAVSVTDTVFRSVSGRPLSAAAPSVLSFGRISNEAGETVDEVLAVRFQAPHSYTGEDMVEISCHGSSYIQQTILSLLLAAGAKTAAPGEFTQRAYLNGKLDLVQAEAVADLIASDSRASHRLAMNQMRGGYSKEFSNLRAQLLELASLLELELDFSEEDVEFADRSRLHGTLSSILNHIDTLAGSFRQGNALKNGIPVAIVGRPNAGKSTLLNALLKEDRAIVSDIAGTTRDVIEEAIDLNGTVFRFIDTAGIRHTEDTLETLGINRTFDRLRKATLVLLVTECPTPTDEIIQEAHDLNLTEGQVLIILLNKADQSSEAESSAKKTYITSALNVPVFILSAKESGSTDALEHYLGNYYTDTLTSETVLISNTRHYGILTEAHRTASAALKALTDGLPTDLVAQDVRETVSLIGELTGEINSEDILRTIFGEFCIGK